ncbi:MAG: PKD domain-containing protein [Anaerolineae bacterium]|nr:MAG: PKD domain-containing protein [Anaerolineae bacterium]
MKISLVWTIICLVTVLAVGLMALLLLPAHARATLLTPHTQFLPRWVQIETPAPPSDDPEGEGPWVVRAYYTDRQMVNDLAAWTEPWEVHHDQGYLVVDVTRAEYGSLLDAGFRLEIDELLTAQLHRPNQRLPGQTSGIPGYPCYRTVDETYAAAQAIVVAHPILAGWTDVGDSWERAISGGNPGYDMKVLRLTNLAIPGPKPRLFIMASVHAREYTPAELSTRFAEHLVNGYSHDPDVTWLLDHHEILLMLQANPDGRKIAETGVYWRKNTDSDDGCTDPNTWGTDLNRNFSFSWHSCGGEGCSSSNPCYGTYRGPSAASEPETQAIQNYLRAQFPDQRAADLDAAAPITATGIFLDIHSYSQLVLWPWGFTGTPTPNGTALRTLGRKFTYCNSYWPGQAIGPYPTDGTTGDFAYGELGLAAFTFELGTAFFQDCATFENTILPDNLRALIYAAKASRAPYLIPAGPDALSPVIEVVASGEAAQLRATIDDTRYSNRNGTEPTQGIAAAEYYIDVPLWVTTPPPVSHAMQATDGAFDEKTEEVTATVDTASLKTGRHLVFLRGQDADGNWGAFSAVFLRVGAGVAVHPATDALTGDPGIAITYTLRVTNTGTHTDSYAIAATGHAWTTDVTPEMTADLGPSAGTDVRVQVTVAPTALAGERDIVRVSVTSHGDSFTSGGVVLTTTANAVYGLWLRPPPATQIGTPGSLVTHTLHITNTGNNTDTFSLALSGGDWMTSVSDSIGPLAAGATGDLPVVADIPADASIGDEDTVTVTAISQGDATQWAASVLTTTVVSCVQVADADIDLTPSAPWAGERVTLTGTVLAGTPPITYIWGFGDGNTGNGQIVTYIFPFTPSAQSYTVSLTASNACGWDVATQHVTVRPRVWYLPLMTKNTEP